MNGNGTTNHYTGNGHNFFAQNGTTDQVTPTSSVDTEDGGTDGPDENIDGDAEASDDDQARRANLSKPWDTEMPVVKKFHARDKWISNASNHTNNHADYAN